MQYYRFVAAAAAKSLQSCPTLRDPMDCSLPGFSVHGNLQARVLEWVAITFSDYRFGASPMTQQVKNPLTMQEILVQSLGGEDTLRRAWQPTQVLLLGEFHGQRSLEGPRPWGY